MNPDENDGNESHQPEVLLEKKARKDEIRNHAYDLLDDMADADPGRARCGAAPEVLGFFAVMWLLGFVRAHGGPELCSRPQGAGAKSEAANKCARFLSDDLRSVSLRSATKTDHTLRVESWSIRSDPNRVLVVIHLAARSSPCLNHAKW